MAGVVSARQVEDALRMVNRNLGQGELPKDLRAWSDCRITSLFNESTPLRKAVGQLLGGEDRVPFIPAAQIALRFPGDFCIDGAAESLSPVPWWSSAWHIDGLHQPPAIDNFTLLIGVALSDVLDDFAGNLAVFPRSHHVLQDYFQREGFEEAKRGLTNLPKLGFADPVQVKLRAGDAVIAHYQLAHTIAPNLSAHVRVMVYFRVKLHQGFNPESMLAIWRDFDPYFQTLATPEQREGGTKPPRQAAYATLLAEKIAADRSRRVSADEAEQLFESKSWSRAAPLFEILSTERPMDWMLTFKCGICLTCVEAERLPQGEIKLRTVVERLAPSYPNARVVLAQNLKRQIIELKIHRHKDEAIRLARQALLEMSRQPDCAIDAVQILRELDAPELPHIVSQAVSRYPELREKIQVEDPVQVLWRQGHKWLQNPEKNVKEGAVLFGKICELAPLDYWAAVLYGGCLFWSGRPTEALNPLDRALRIDPQFPHAYSIGAQVRASLNRSDEAVDLVARMLDVDGLKLLEPDHFDKVIEALQVVARSKSPRFILLRDTARALFPSLNDRILAL